MIKILYLNICNGQNVQYSFETKTMFERENIEGKITNQIVVFYNR